MSDPYLGRDVNIEVILAAASGSPTNGVYSPPTTGWLPLGGTRGLSKSQEWDTVDTTSRSSAGAVRSSVATFLSTSGSIDGLYIKDTASNVKAADDYINDPTSGQPAGWIRLSYPAPTGNQVIRESLYVLFSSFSSEMPHDEVMTFSIDYNGKQPWVKETVTP